MIVNITNRNDNKVSDSLRERIECWLENSQDRYETITSAQVTIAKAEREGEAKVEATVHVAGNDVFAKAEGANLYAALDALEDKIDRQLDRIHQKHVSKKGVQKPDPVQDDEADEAEEEAVFS